MQIRSMKFVKAKSKDLKFNININWSKDNTNCIITFREPMLAENLVSKNNLLSPDCFWTENSKFKRKSALKINERIM